MMMVIMKARGVARSLLDVGRVTIDRDAPTCPQPHPLSGHSIDRHDEEDSLL